VTAQRGVECEGGAARQGPIRQRRRLGVEFVERRIDGGDGAAGGTDGADRSGRGEDQRVRQQVARRPAHLDQRPWAVGKRGDDAARHVIAETHRAGRRRHRVIDRGCRPRQGKALAEEPAPLLAVANRFSIAAEHIAAEARQHNVIAGQFAQIGIGNLVERSALGGAQHV
jgi:hypothetical protein